MNQLSSVIRTLAFLGALTVLAAADGADTKVVYSLQKIPAGTTVVDAKADHWNQLILLARPMLTSGDIDRISSSLQQSVSRFSYTILATVSNSPPVPSADPRKEFVSHRFKRDGHSASVQLPARGSWHRLQCTRARSASDCDRRARCGNRRSWRHRSPSSLAERT